MKAYTVSELTSAGWTQVTDLTSVTLADNYFMFVDAGTSLYSVTNARPGTDSKPTYQALQNPTADWAQVWKLSKDAQNNYLIQSNIDDWYFISAANAGQGWTDKMSSESTNGGFTFEALGSNKYSIKGVYSNGFVGPWSDDGVVNLNNNLHWGALDDDYYEELACNKNDAQSPDFYIFYISRTSYDAARRSSATLETEGWSKVTATSGLGKAGYYYTFLDLSETNYETGLAMIGTNGRPKYTSVADPVANTEQLWTTESHNEGYALKNVGVDKYLYLATNDTWNTGFTSDINSANTTFVATVSEGKWTLSNSLNTSQFVGRWSNSPYAPGTNEDIAANKAADAGKRQFYIYSIPTIAGVAEALPGNGDMTADTWYYIDIPATADNYTATATALANIVYTSDGATLVKNGSTVTNQFTETDNYLTATRYYVKSSTGNNLVIGVSSYTYNVGTPTSSIANNAYIASLSTIDFTFSDAGTTDPDASFALLNGSAKAVLSKGGENVAEGTLSLSGNVLTATFSDVALALSSTYDIAIAAGVVGYEGEETNAAINTSFRTGIIADGVYYFKRNGTETYLTRGGNYGTENVTDKFGISFEAILQNDGTYTLKNVDQSFVDNTNKYLNEQYTDQGAYKWTIESTDGGYLLKRANGSYVTTAEEGTYHYNYMANAADAASAIVWTILTKSEYQSSLTARKNSEAAAVAAAAGKSVTTEAALIAELEENFGETDMTLSITNAALTENATGWTAVSYNSQRRNQADGVDVIRFNGTAEVWSYIGGAKQTISSLPSGIYKITVKSVWRIGDAAQAGRAGNEANVTAWMYAESNGVTDYTQLKSWYDHQAANTTAVKNSTNDDYVNTVYVYVPEGQDLTIGIASPSWSGTIWMPFCGWTLTRYEAKATPAEKTALSNAISAAEAKTLGFENSEYAPYNNTDALAKLAAAKAINPETASGAAVVAATTALTGATWNANAEEVNAIYWDYSTMATTEKSKAYGWYDPALSGNAEGSMYSTRVFNHVGSNAGLAAVENNVALFTKVSTNYGKVAGYTLPLKANRTYRLSFKYAGWAEPSESTISITDKNGENPLAISGVVTVSGDAQNGNSDASVWANYEGFFAVPADGDYVLNINRINMGGNVQRQLVMGNIDLRTAEGLTFADNAVPTYAPGTYPSVKITRTLTAGKWATAVYPFAVSGVDNIAVLDSYNGETGEIRFATAAASTANEPFLMRSTAGTKEISLSNVAVAATATEPVVTKNNASLKGVYASGTVSEEADVVRYVVSNNQLYKVNSDVNIKPFRAYFELADGNSSARLAFNFDDATGINAIEAAEAEAGALKDGKYLENGKIVIVKNGVKYSANGQILK